MFYDASDKITLELHFFMEKGKANERTDRLMVSDHRHPRPRVTPEELQLRCWS